MSISWFTRASNSNFGALAGCAWAASQKKSAWGGGHLQYIIIIIIIIVVVIVVVRVGYYGNRVLLEKLVVTQLVKKFLACYGTRRFITVFTRTRHCSLS
jgi:hypothetical protein